MRILSSNYQDFALDINKKTLMPDPTSLVATDVTDKVAGKKYYGEIIDTLEQIGRYSRGRPGETQNPDDRKYYLFVYDWRNDNVQTARKLDDLIEQIRKD